MPRFVNNGFYNDDDLRSCIYCGNFADSKDHTPSRFLCKNLQYKQSSITVPCCNSCNNKFSKIEGQCKKILDSYASNINSLTDIQIADLQIIAIKNAIGIIFHFYGVKLEYNDNIRFSIETNIVADIFFENFTIWNFEVSPTIELSLEPYLVFSIPNTDVIGIIKDNIAEIGDTVIGYSNEPYCVKFLYKNNIGFTVIWDSKGNPA